jgi:hypothetical protein
MRDSAIRKLYPIVVTINGDAEGIDKDGKIVNMDDELIDDEVVKQKALSLIPTTITKRQGMRAMKQTPSQSGKAEDTLWSDLQAIFTQNQDAKDDYDSVNELDKNDPVLIELTSALKITSEQLDNLFLMASEL